MVECIRMNMIFELWYYVSLSVVLYVCTPIEVCFAVSVFVRLCTALDPQTIHSSDGRAKSFKFSGSWRTDIKAERYPTSPYMPIEPTNFNHIFDVWTNDGSRMDGQKQNDRQSDRQTGCWGEGGGGSHFMVVIKWVNFLICSIDSGGF